MHYTEGGFLAAFFVGPNSLGAINSSNDLYASPGPLV